MAKTPLVRSRWSPPLPVKPVKWDEVTKQEFANECDINVILARYDQVEPRPGLRWGEFADAPEDFLAAQLLVKNAEERFNSFDARVRERFKHSPVEMLRFLSDPANKAEAIALGLVQAPPPEPPKETP